MASVTNFISIIYANPSINRTTRHPLKRTLIAVALLAASAGASADSAVRGYIRSDGTVVAPHYRSSPNGNQFDNYGARGNTNPYTGQSGSGPSEFYPSGTPRPSAPSYPAPSPYYRTNPYGTSRR